MQIALLLGRICFSGIFILASFSHFSQSTIDYAAQQNVPWPEFFVPFSGVIALIGGISVLLGYQAKVGAALLITFLIPVTIQMHHFWDLTSPSEAQLQGIMFMKNLSMLGGALVILYFGAGPMSIDMLKIPSVEEKRERKIKRPLEESQVA